MPLRKVISLHIRHNGADEFAQLCLQPHSHTHVQREPEIHSDIGHHDHEVAVSESTNSTSTQQPQL